MRISITCNLVYPWPDVARRSCRMPLNQPSPWLDRKGLLAERTVNCDFCLEHSHKYEQTLTQNSRQPEKMHLECFFPKCCYKERFVQKDQKTGRFYTPWKIWPTKMNVLSQLWQMSPSDDDKDASQSPPRTKMLAKVRQRWTQTTHLQPNLAAWRTAGINILGMN